MSITLDHYTALVEYVYEKYALGQIPPEDLLLQIKTAQVEHVEWVVPPPPPPLNGHANGHANGHVAPPPPPPPASPPRAALVTNIGERPDITVDENMERISRDVLAWWGTRFCVFQSGGRLLEVQKDSGKDVEFLAREPDSPRMTVIGSIRARALASRECNFVKEKVGKDGKEENTDVLPPEWLGPTIVTRTDFPGIPVFAALAQAPTLRRDGALISEPGYDKSTGIYLTSDLKVVIPEHPTLLDAQRSLFRLMSLVVDFDFTNPAGKSVWLALLLSTVCRHTFDGPVPISIIDASKRGSGKTRLVDMASVIAIGRTAPRMIYSPDDTEMDKRITALGIASEQFVLIDNIVGKLASPSLDAALTSDTYRGRILGKTEMTQAIPMKIIWCATGNGMIIGADTARRALLARLEPPVDHPEHRVGPRPGVRWRHKLPDYCFENRAELLGCALIIVSAYIQAGRPSVDIENSDALADMGSFEKWSNTIRNAIIWAGGLDPCETIKDAQAADVEDLALRTMIDCWPLADDVPASTADLIEKASITLGDPNPQPSRAQWRNALLGWLPAKAGAPLPTARDLGYALRSVKGSIVGNYKLETGTHDRNGTPWKRVQISAKILHFSNEKQKEEVQK